MSILFSYGLERSGSTLGFEASKYLLETYGYSQSKVQHKLLDPLKKQENFIPDELLNNLDLLKELNDNCNFVVFKTHSKLLKPTREFILKNNIPFSISIRDPRDIIISLLEIGKKIRESGETGVFNYIYNFDIALTHFRDNLEKLKTWIPLLENKNGCLIIYENFINNSEPLLSYISNLLDQVKVDHSLVKFGCANRFTQFNKGIPGRGSILLKEKEVIQLLNDMNFLNNLINVHSEINFRYKLL